MAEPAQAQAGGRARPGAPSVLLALTAAGMLGACSGEGGPPRTVTIGEDAYPVHHLVSLTDP